MSINTDAIADAVLGGQHKLSSDPDATLLAVGFKKLEAIRRIEAISPPETDNSKEWRSKFNKASDHIRVLEISREALQKKNERLKEAISEAQQTICKECCFFRHTAECRRLELLVFEVG